MTHSEMLWVAKIAIEKRWDFEKMKYSDYLYGKEDHAEDVWEYVTECDKIGQDSFWEKYKDV